MAEDDTVRHSSDSRKYWEAHLKQKQGGGGSRGGK